MPDSCFSDGYDVMVAGGGPAGATAATLSSLYRHRVLLRERSAEPKELPRLPRDLINMPVGKVCREPTGPLVAALDEVAVKQPAHSLS